MQSPKTALVTGSTRGIGRAIASSLSAAGYVVVVSGRNENEVSDAASAIGGVGIAADLGSAEGVRTLIGQVVAKVSRIDVLVNNAGIAESAPYDRTSDESWERMMMVNASAPFQLCRAFIPQMIAGGFGRVVNVASNAGRVGYPYTSAYCASKHALIGMTRGLAAELAKTPVTVNAVCPGWVRTDMAAEAASRIANKTHRSESEAERALAAMSPQNRLIEPEEVAHLVMSLLADQARGINGQALVLDGGQVMA